MRETTTIETIGCDLGDKKSTLFVLRPDNTFQVTTVNTTRTAMKECFAHPPAHVVIEVGTHSRWVSELLEELGHRVTIANPRRVQLIARGDSKKDRLDAERLARLGRVDTALLSPIEHRTDGAQIELAVIKARDLLVGTRTKLVNHVRSVVKSYGERLPPCTAESFHRRTEELIPSGLKLALSPIYRALAEIDEQIRSHERVIRQLAKKEQDVPVPTQVDGVGDLTALAFLRTIDDKNRFAKSREVGPFLGITPKTRQSGDSDPQLHITKAGDPLLRRLLVNSANYILGPFGKDSDLRRWGLKLAERGGRNAKKRATIAVSRKLAVLLHRLWVTGEVYQPIGYRQTRLSKATAVA